MFYELFINHLLGLYEPQPIIKLILYFGIQPTIKGIKFLRINHLSHILFFHAAKVRKILIASKYSGRNLLLFRFSFEKGINTISYRSRRRLVRKSFCLYGWHALKGQKLLAQGSALGIMAVNKAPCKGKSFKTPVNNIKFLSLQVGCIG